MNGLIEIRLTKYRLFLTEPELTGLLAKDPALWETAVKRGKGITRARTAAGREVKIKREDSR